MADETVAPTEPLVSVVIIFLNAQRFLAQAIDSVYAQTWRRWELLLVDDGSADGSTRMAREHAAADPRRVRYLDHEGHRNRGMSASRNLGSAHAAGEWLAFLDSDDVWTGDALARQMTAIRDHPGVDLVYGPAIIWHSWDPANTQPDGVQNLRLPAGVVADGARLAAHFVEHGTATPCHGATVMRWDTWRRLGGFEEAFPGMYEDQVFWFKAALGARVLVTAHSSLMYRQHPNSCCSVEFRTSRHVTARMRFLRWARRHAARVGAHDPYLNGTLRRHLRSVRWSTGIAGRLRRGVRRLLPEPLAIRLRSYR